jgi:hypothetical protein
VNRIENQTFENVVVNFDGYQYHKCTFNHCQLVFTGMAPVNVADCTIRGDCQWSFAGPAMNCFSFLAALWKNPASRPLVETVFQMIRTGGPPQPAPAPLPEMPTGTVN